MRTTDILIVDDEVGIRDLLSEILQDEGYGVALAEDVASARALRAETRPALVLLDIWLPDGDGLSLLKEWMNEGLLNMPVVVMSGHAGVDTAREATKIGAIDFLEKPISLQKLLTAVENGLKYSSGQETAHIAPGKLGEAECIVRMFEQLDEVRDRDMILLSGETGSPFDIVADYFHDRRRPWIAPGVEQWLHPSKNWFEAAQGGSLWLGNVALYDLPVQNAVVKTLQSRKQHHNVRVIAGCSRPLSDFFSLGGFSKELGDLLAVNTVVIPPLRTHLSDLPKNVETILIHLVETRQARLVHFNASAFSVMRQYGWPGNFDQLRQVVKSAALSAKKGIVDGAQITQILERYRNRYGNETCGFDFNVTLRELRDEVERRYFEYHIRRETGNMSQVAQRVGLERTHLYRKLKQLGVHFSKREKSE